MNIRTVSEHEDAYRHGKNSGIGYNEFLRYLRDGGGDHGRRDGGNEREGGDDESCGPFSFVRPAEVVK